MSMCNTTNYQSIRDGDDDETIPQTCKNAIPLSVCNSPMCAYVFIALQSGDALFCFSSIASEHKTNKDNDRYAASTQSNP